MLSRRLGYTISTWLSRLWRQSTDVIPCTATVLSPSRTLLNLWSAILLPCRKKKKKKEKLEMSSTHLCNVTISWDSASHLYLHIAIHKTVNYRRPRKKSSSSAAQHNISATRGKYLKMVTSIVAKLRSFENYNKITSKISDHAIWCVLCNMLRNCK